MRQLARLGTLVMLLALGTSFGCSKDDSKAQDTTTAGTKQAEAKNVAGMAKETLLALKFHHDS